MTPVTPACVGILTKWPQWKGQVGTDRGAAWAASKNLTCNLSEPQLPCGKQQGSGEISLGPEK